MPTTAERVKALEEDRDYQINRADKAEEACQEWIAQVAHLSRRLSALEEHSPTPESR